MFSVLVVCNKEKKTLPFSEHYLVCFANLSPVFGVGYSHVTFLFLFVCPDCSAAMGIERILAQRDFVIYSGLGVQGDELLSQPRQELLS